MTAFDDPTTRSFARVAGVLYLVIAVAGFFSILYVPGQLTVPGDPASTLAAIAARPGLFALGVGGDVVMMTAEVVLAVMLFAMFRPFGAVLATAALVARLMMAAVMAAMLLPQAAILALATDPSLAGEGQAAWLAATLARMDAAGVWVWQVFFALHLWMLGALALRSRAVPRLLAIGLVVGGAGYLVDSVRAFAFDGSMALSVIGGALLAVVTLSEIGFALWLLTRGRVAASEAPMAGRA
ncbi:DUF4386 domain-containing protein [Jannaschia seohaensis]|uniref:Uncharacterized protein DUF4386 n=1 Tax=Jannaschia seohaensis TaxID=475081 RepID=A0A2Y9C5J1_9RHOB|nr:DUF4386 domain-containing protein [Jannaschia seohaensis]PWJ20993.1 uncharacterized protein DUF4386 [Jannaschia seohaensis]SSA41403.1 protein of unknown function [Jannaschia seohaensis]